MLKYLHIENIAVIERSDIEFKEGFNVLSGETGAGKSIVIDSINAVLGERTSKDLIRTGCDKAEVSALFGEISKDNLEKISAFDIYPDEDGNILISRTLSLNGKGIIKINGKPFTASTLREIAEFLIDIHGQHDNQALLNPDKHCSFLDSVADNSKEIADYYAEFKSLNSIRRELQSLEMDEDEKKRKNELLTYQIKELEEADIKVGEIEVLKQKLKIAENFEQIQKSLTVTDAIFKGDDETDGVILLLKNAAKQIGAVNEESFSQLFEKLQNVISAVEDISDTVTSKLYNENDAELNTDSINQRLDLLYRLMLKYGNSEEKMLEFLESAKKELENITFSDKRSLELENELENAKERLIERGDALSLTRAKAAEKFQFDVLSVLKYLNMPDVQFFAEITKGRYTKNGCDTVEFMISANSGETAKPLHKIASGGELSRIMLSIKSALADSFGVDTMIFDEIDTGISGYAADKVGTQLKKVSRGRQVICVTHLAQIAAMADNHLLIEKSSKGDRTFTEVTPLSYEERIKEIARIMSGSEITENLYNSAKELLDRSKTNENL